MRRCASFSPCSSSPAAAPRPTTRTCPPERLALPARAEARRRAGARAPPPAQAGLVPRPACPASRTRAPARAASPGCRRARPTAAASGRARARRAAAAAALAQGVKRPAGREVSPGAPAAAAAPPASRPQQARAPGVHLGVGAAQAPAGQVLLANRAPCRSSRRASQERRSVPRQGSRPTTAPRRRIAVATGGRPTRSIAWRTLPRARRSSVGSAPLRRIAQTSSASATGDISSSARRGVQTS